jgi:hypothetical protein
MGSGCSWPEGTCWLICGMKLALRFFTDTNIIINIRIKAEAERSGFRPLRIEHVTDVNKNKWGCKMQMYHHLSVLAPCYSHLHHELF